jgi:molecular chaperone DnaK (HSP70)
MATSSSILGIDFGTTRTVVAARSGGNSPICTFTWKGEFKEYIPSLVAVSRGRISYGWRAAELLHRPDVQALRSIKRLAGRMRPDDRVDFGKEGSFPLIDLMTGFLSHVRRMIIRCGNLPLEKRKPLEVLAAVPANANSNQRYLTFEALRRSGFILRGAMNEPAAAAVEYLQRHLKHLSPRSPKRYVVIYDLGGGTFDAAVVGIVGQGHEVIGYEGIELLGGDDFDHIILDMVLESAGASRRRLTPSESLRMLEECRDRKEGLKPNTRKIMVDLDCVWPEADPVMLESADLYERCEPLIRSSLRTLETLLKRTVGSTVLTDDIRSLAAVYLVGGSVVFPPVARILRESFGAKVRSTPFPHASVAMGLAAAGDPSAGIRVRESISRNFGLWREQGTDKVFDPIFVKNRQLDSKTGRSQAIRHYRPVHNIGRLRYLECSALGSRGEPEGDIFMWKDIFFPYDPDLTEARNLHSVSVVPRPDLASQEVLETYEYDERGIVRIEIENRTAGYRRRYQLTPTHAG